MNLTQAEAIVTLYQELIESIDKTKIPLPEYASGRFFTLDQLQSITLEDGQIKIHWSRYAGCGDYDSEDTYHSLESLFD